MNCTPERWVYWGYQSLDWVVYLYEWLEEVTHVIINSGHQPRTLISSGSHGLVQIFDVVAARDCVAMPTEQLTTQQRIGRALPPTIHAHMRGIPTT